MRILVTGGAGFIGSHVVDTLVARGHDVIVLDNLDAQVHGPARRTPVNLEVHVASRSIEFIHGDIRDSDALDKALPRVESVVHLAAAVGVGQSMYAPFYYADVNVSGQARLFEHILSTKDRIRRLIVASSMSIYGEGSYLCEEHGVLAPPPRKEEQLKSGEWELRCPHCGDVLVPTLTDEDKPLHPTSIYAITKKTQEDMALCFGRAHGLSTVALRLFNVYGSRQALSNPYTGVAAIFLARLKNSRAPIVFEDGRQSRDFIHVSDVAEAVTRAVEVEDDLWGVYNICTGHAVTVREVAESLAQRLGVEIEPKTVRRYRAGDIRHCIGDPSRARRELGFEATVDFAKGLSELIEWSGHHSAEDRVEDSLVELEKHGLVK